MLLARDIANESTTQDGAASLNEGVSPKESTSMPISAFSPAQMMVNEAVMQEDAAIQKEPISLKAGTTAQSPVVSVPEEMKAETVPLIENPVDPSPKEMQEEAVRSTDPWVLGNEAYLQEQWRDAYRYFKRAAKTGKAKVFRKLADMYYEGIGLPEADYKKAFQYYKLAAAKGGAYSMYRLGMMYIYGEGVEPSKLDALAWLGSAVESGYQNAKADYERVDNELQLDDIIPAEKLFLIKM